MRGGLSERMLIFLIGAVQFINVLDFMMVMPLGPDFAISLGIPTAHLGWIGGSYTAAAAVAGVLGSLFLDRFDRRVALGVAMAGLVVGTALGGFATGFSTLLGARIIAGAFGGPATSISLSIIADAVPPERRGRALGAVMGAFSLASIVGVPVGLWLAEIGGWRMPFFGVAGLGLVLIAMSIGILPPMRKHLESGAPPKRGIAIELLHRPEVRLALACYSAVMISVFAVVPNISAYVIYNIHYPREHLGMLYLVGGIANFIAMRGAGWLVDRHGAPPIAWIGAALYAFALSTGFIVEPPLIPVLLLFAVMMTSQAFRAVPVTTLATQVPQPAERAGYMSMQSAVQHVSSSIGAFTSAQILGERADHGLSNMPTVAMIALAIAVLVPILVGMIQARLRLRPSLARAGGEAAPSLE